MTKYKIVKESKALPEGWEVGDVVEFSKNFSEPWTVQRRLYVISQLHLNALLELGVVEEVKEWNSRELKDGDKYWAALDGLFGEDSTDTVDAYLFVWRGWDRDIFNRALGNCHPTKEAAESWRDKILTVYNS